MEKVYILLTLLLTTILLLNATLLLTTLFRHRAMIQKEQIISIVRHH